MAEMKWTAELEVALFHSMHNHKPVGEERREGGAKGIPRGSWPAALSPLLSGLNKHFHMACVQWRLQRLHSISLTTEQIWKHLSTLYDLKTLVSFSAVHTHHACMYMHTARTGCYCAGWV